MTAAPIVGYGGLTHLGLVSSLAAAAKGFETVAYDPDAAVAGEVDGGRFRVMEPGLDELFARARPRYTATADAAALGRCDVVYIAVDVPTDDTGRSDVAPVRDLLARVVEVAKPGASLVVLSQVHPGFTRAERPRVERPGGPRLFYQVETLIFGRAVERALHPERYMVGCADPAEPLPPALRQCLEAFGCPILPMRDQSAELCKISINMFLVASVSTTNMLAEVCEAVGADWREIAPALRLDKRIGPHAYLTPGLGVGGGNLTRDLATIDALARERGTDARIVAAWNDNTRHRRDWALMTLWRAIPLDPERTVLAMWGLAYKEHTQFTKNSPALHLAGQLRGIAIRAYDPAAHVPAGVAPAWLARTATALDACWGADALIVMTPWPEFASVDLADVRGAMRGRLIVDPFGVIDAAASARLGFAHERLGTGRLTH